MSTPSQKSRHDERRQHPRVPARGKVNATVLDDPSAVTIVDLSNGGFLLESSHPFLVNSIHQFRIATSKGDWLTLLTARSMHSRQNGSGYLTGFAFVEPLGAEARQRVHTLVEHVTSVVSF
jgi:hypothetical protein